MASPCAWRETGSLRSSAKGACRLFAVCYKRSGYLRGAGRGLLVSPLAVPLAFFHVHVISIFKDYAFIEKQLSLLRKMRSQSAGVVYNPVAGIVAIIGGLTQHPSHHSCIIFSAGQSCNLTVGSHFSFGYFFYNGKNFINYIFVHAAPF